ncbi:MAG: hypothetical protein IKP01_01465, partial [Bacteroidales bacterium]|nr:hypothetical protein [Bacteroidales bacterium]
FIQYNKSSGQERFRYYKNAQTDGEIQLYKLSDGGVTPPAATLSAIEVSGQTTTFTVGDTFVFDGKVTAKYTDGSTKDVTALAEFSSPNLSTVGTREVTVTYTEGGITQTAKYNITVNADVTHAGTVDDPYTVADAMAATAAMNEGQTSSESYYTKGIVSEIVEVSTDYGNATYFISDDGTTATQFKVFRGKYIGNMNFTSADQLKVGDEVVVYGKLKYYKGNPSELEIDQYNYIHSLKRNGVEVHDFSVSTSADRVPSSASSVKVNVYGNVDWKVSVTSPATVDVTSGSGIGVVTVSIPENTSTTDEVRYTVTVERVGAGEKFILDIYQDKKDASGAVTITGTSAASAGMTGERGAQHCTIDGVSVDISDGIVSGDQIRIYKNATITITAPDGKKLKKVEFTCTANDENQYGPGCFAEHDGYSYSGKVGTWEGADASLTLTASSAQVRATSIVVTCE